MTPAGRALLLLRRRAIVTATNKASLPAAASHIKLLVDANPNPNPHQPPHQHAGHRKPVRWLSSEWGKLPASTPPSRIWSFEEVCDRLEEGDSVGPDSDGEKRSPPSRVEGEEDVYFVDVREKHELVKTGKIPGAINIPMSKAVEGRGCWRIGDNAFEENYGFRRPPRNAHVVFYCRAGVRAHAAAVMASEAGWKSVGEYPGSWLDWSKCGGTAERVFTDIDENKRWRPFVNDGNDEGDPRES
ncbi:hypothetical protein XA68_12390 [Ophiocordyceps unilateralis]|uniref:Rhodanese domain-containing protein n=1 Tax=Ophiocordyceps unilateralis TaxID=268505 RepID=A0A2A9PPA6_OPHUN|nr:hypothetical protein XA68_12390 [Ophiocordyceps unilateralis]